MYRASDFQFTYDGLNRLIDFERGELNNDNDAISGATIGQDWTLDPTGNWNNFNQTVADALTQTRAHNTVNEITNITETEGDEWPTPAYDNNGNTTTLPQPKDLDASYTATYDAWNRLVKIADTSGTVAEYEYDGLNRRIIRDETGGSGVLTHFYYSDNWQCLEERVGSATTASKQYVWGLRYIDDLVLSDASSTRYYYAQDANFNVVAALDDDGAVEERYAYTPYGEVVFLDSGFANPSSSSAIGNEFQYTGRRLDPETGLYQCRYRYLHVQLGRWVNRDPIGYRGGMNLYAYVGGMPTGYVDPWGLEPWGAQPWVWPWDNRATWNPCSTACLWWDKGSYYGGHTLYGAGKGGCNVVCGVGEGVAELGCQGVDIGGSGLELCSAPVGRWRDRLNFSRVFMEAFDRAIIAETILGRIKARDMKTLIERLKKETSCTIDIAWKSGAKEGREWAFKYARRGHLRQIGEGEMSFDSPDSNVMNFLYSYYENAGYARTHESESEDMEYERYGDIETYRRGFNQGFVEAVRHVWDDIKSKLR